MSFLECYNIHKGQLPPVSKMELPNENWQNKKNLSKCPLVRFYLYIIRELDDLCKKIQHVFSHSKKEWVPVSDQEFQEFKKDVTVRNLKNFTISSHLLNPKVSSTDITEGNKQALLDRIYAIKSDFFHKNLDSVSSIPENLQGNTMTDSLFSFIGDLTVYAKKKSNDEEIKKKIELFQKAYQFAVEAEVIDRLIDSRDKAQLSNQYTNKITDKLKDLKPGERFVLPTGVKGHALLYEFQCRKDGDKRLFDFKLINSGDGVEHHLSKSFLSSINPKAKYQTYFIQGVGASFVEDGKFIEKLVDKELGSKLKAAKIPIIGWLIQMFYSFRAVPDIYKLTEVTLIKQGGGELVRSDDPRMTHKPQKHGICSRKIYAYWMQENTKDRFLYEDFKYETAKFSLSRLRATKLFEDKLKGRTRKANGLRYQIFVKPHWFSLRLMSLRNHMSTESMLLLGEKALEKRKQRLDAQTAHHLMPLPPVA